MFPTKQSEISRRQSNHFEKKGMTIVESQPLPQTITVPEVQEWCTVWSIHQLQTLAAATVPRHESTSGLREWQ